MTLRQRFLKLVYPLLMLFGRRAGKTASAEEPHLVTPPASFYDLGIRMNNQEMRSCSTFRGKKVLLVNTASDCGLTGQYDELQRLHEEYGEKVVVVGFPANDFKEQEKGSDEEIAAFCRVNYGVTFPLAAKSTVVPGKDQNEVFQWLTNASMNGWNKKAPEWNFSKYLVNEQGMLTHYFSPSLSPLASEVINAIKKE